VPEDEEDVSSGVRTFWSGAITFGLVSVPVSLLPANRPRTISLRMVDDDGHPLQRRYVCSKDGKELDWDEIVRGYEVKKGKFVVISDEELEAIEPRKSREIDLQVFVGQDEIDPMFFERAYYLVPSAGSTKAYRLLAEVMEKKERAGVATFVMRGKEYLVAIFAERGVLRAETLRFEDEVRKPEDVGLPKKSKVKPSAVSKFAQEITRHSGKVNFREFFDEYARRLEQLAEKKERRGVGVIKAPVEAAASAEEGGAEVIDLLQVLKQSLGGERKPARRAPARKATKGRRKSR
jgi:DNA end-binding protein Ku